MKSVYCAVQTEYLNLFQVNFSLLGCAMDYAVIGRPVTAESGVRSRVSPSENYGGQSGTGTGFSSPSTSVFSSQDHSTIASYSYVNAAVKERTSGRSLGTFIRMNPCIVG